MPPRRRRQRRCCRSGLRVLSDTAYTSRYSGDIVHEKAIEVLVRVDTILEAIDEQSNPYRLSMEAYDIVQRALEK